MEAGTGVWRWGRIVLALVTLFTLVMVVASLWPWIRHGGLYSGDSRTAKDVWQYLSWVRESGSHVLIANRFDSSADYEAVFFHPVFFLSGVLWALGVPIQLAFFVWKPIAVLALVYSVTAFVGRHVQRSGERLVAALLAIFMFTPTQALIEAANIGGERGEDDIDRIQSDLFLAQHLAGSLPLLLSVAALTAFFIGAERIVSRSVRPSTRLLLGTAGAGMLASWCHPWQGLTALLVVGLGWAWARLDRRWLRLVIPVAATIAPLAYYAILDRTSAAFQVVSDREIITSSVWIVLLALLPLVAVALPGVRRPPADDVGGRLLMLWPLVALLLYFALGPSHYGLHALNGISIPLGVLAVLGFRRLRGLAPARRRAVAVMALILLLGSVPIFTYRTASGLTRDLYRNVEIPGVDRALEAIAASPAPGGVLTIPEVGAAVPAMTGRSTWVGHQAWSPRWFERGVLADGLVFGDLPADEVRAVVDASRARFIIAYCKHDLTPILGRRLVRKQKFHCVEVYELRPVEKAATASS